MTLVQIFLWASTVQAATKILCNNAGLQYAVFNNTQGPNPTSNSVTYPNYNVNYMKDPSVGGQGTRNLLYTSTTSKVGGISGSSGGTFSAYGGPNVIPCDSHSFMYRGYIYPPESGIYTLSASDIDDIGMLWIGSAAQSGWNRNNALMIATYLNRPPTQTTSTSASNSTFLWLDAGKYYPIRFVHANGDGWRSAFFSIVSPLGNVILGANTGDSVSIVQYSCDGSTAPQYPYKFGAEA